MGDVRTSCGLSAVEDEVHVHVMLDAEDATDLGLKCGVPAGSALGHNVMLLHQHLGLSVAGVFPLWATM